MNRTSIRRILQNNLRLADLANQCGWSDQQLIDYKQQARSAKFNRRQLLAAAAGAAVLSSCKTISNNKNEVKTIEKNPSTEVIILGAGLAGLMAAYRLQKLGYATRIYEAREHVGGRVQTKNQFNADGMFIELGAEFVDTPHKHLIGLAQELGVAIDEYVDTSLQLEAEVLFMNGKMINPDQFMPEFRKLARLIRNDTVTLRQGKELIYPRFGQPGPNPRLDRISLADYLQEKQQQGVASNFTKLIEIMYLGMYGLECSEQSAYNLLMLIDIDADELAIYGESDESKRVRGGNSRLVEALEKAVRKNTAIELGHNLIQIADDGTNFQLDFATAGASKTVNAKAIICAMPFTTVRDVQGIKNLKLSPAKKQAIENLGYASNAKFTMGFKEAFWQKGSQILPANYGTVYSDRLVKEVRASSNNQRGTSGIILNYLSGKQGAIASSNLVAETLEHLDFLYPGAKKLADGNKNLQHWASDPFVKASYSCFKIGHYSAMGGFEDPVELDGRMIFAGEHMNMDWGGYMEGALASGQTAAELIGKGSQFKLYENTWRRRRPRRS